MKLVTALVFVNVNYDIEMIIGDRTAVGHLSLLVIVYLYDLYDRGVEDRDSLHTMPGSSFVFYRVFVLFVVGIFIDVSFVTYFHQTLSYHNMYI